MPRFRHLHLTPGMFISTRISFHNALPEWSIRIGLRVLQRHLLDLSGSASFLVKVCARRRQLTYQFDQNSPTKFFSTSSFYLFSPLVARLAVSHTFRSPLLQLRAVKTNESPNRVFFSPTAPCCQTQETVLSLSSRLLTPVVVGYSVMPPPCLF